MLEMLQGDRSRRLIGELAQDRDDQGGSGELINFAFGLLRRQWLLILFVGVLGVAASLIYLKITPPTYTAQVKVLFGSSKPQLGQQQSILTDSPFDHAQLESQMQILTSKAVVVAVIDQLKLAEDPDFRPRAQPLTGLFGRVKALLGGAEPATEANERPNEPDDLVAAFEDRLVIARIGFSNVIEIKYSASDPKRAAEVANALANTYIADQLNAKFEAEPHSDYVAARTAKGSGPAGPDSRACRQCFQVAAQHRCGGRKADG